MSVYPWYKQITRGASMDPSDMTDFIERRSTRSKSAYPEVSYLREPEPASLPNYSLLSRALSKYRDPPSPVFDSDNLDRYTLRNAVGRLRETQRQSEDYWLNRYHELYPASARAPYTSRTYYPSAYYPYYGNSSSMYSYSRPYWQSAYPTYDYSYYNYYPYRHDRPSYVDTPFFLRHMYL